MYIKRTLFFLFFQCSNLFLLFKNFKKAYSGVSNGHSGVSKWANILLKRLVSLVISKLALLPILRLPLAHLRLPHEPFLKFSSRQEKIFSSKKGKKNHTNYYLLATQPRFSFGIKKIKRLWYQKIDPKLAKSLTKQCFSWRDFRADFGQANLA